MASKLSKGHEYYWGHDKRHGGQPQEASRWDNISFNKNNSYIGWRHVCLNLWVHSDNEK